jgi:predicted enzyme related to lactoylglutathione lyase
MAEKRFPPGTFSWIELGTTDIQSASRFYSGLLGWTVKEMPMPGGRGTYMIFQLEGKDVAGGYDLYPAQKEQGVPPHWLSYVMVDSADESAAKAKKLGATVLADVMDVPEVGKIAILQDPTEATFALFQAGAHQGAAPLDNRPGTFTWNELATKDPKKAKEFYQSLFGWTSEDQDMGPAGTYTTFSNKGRMAAGMLRINPQWGPVPPHWAVYFAVNDCEAAVSKATQTGAEVRMPPTDIPEVGRFSVLMDPQGAAFNVIKLLNPEPN